MREFLHVYEHPSHAIDTRLISQAQEQVEENKQVIVSLFKIVMLLGKQGVAFRGHRDDRVVFDSDTEDEVIASNQGNFIEMVRFRAETDEILAKHLKNGPKNARYTSKSILYLEASCNLIKPVLCLLYLNKHGVYS